MRRGEVRLGKVWSVLVWRGAVWHGLDAIIGKLGLVGSGGAWSGAVGFGEVRSGKVGFSKAKAGVTAPAFGFVIQRLPLTYAVTYA